MKRGQEVNVFETRHPVLRHAVLAKFVRCHRLVGLLQHVPCLITLFKIRFTEKLLPRLDGSFTK